MELPADHQVIGYQEHTINKCYNVDGYTFVLGKAESHEY